MSDPSGDVQPRAEYFARNLIGGRWEFPAAPFDYEIRSPLDGAVITAVPLSSRLDVARAVSAAKSAAGSWAADPAARHALLTALAAQLSALSGPLARLQAAETGLDLADSTAVTGAVNLVCQRLIAANRWQGDQAAGGKVSGHILSWGLPFAEVACAVTAHLAAGHTVVIKPSLRGPLSAAAFGQLATKAGFPAGVINIVQGTGVDVGTALIGTAELDFLQVRAGQRTLSQAERAAAATGVPASWLRAGGNIAVAGGDADVELVATAVTDALRTHSTGGPLALPFLCVQTDVAGPITDAIMAKLEQCRPAPLPAESLRDRALARIASLKLAGAHLLGGGVVPDDARHRMGWILPPTVLAAGAASHLTGAEPIGPVLTMLTWRRAADLTGLFLDPRYRQGLAFTWGLHTASLQAAALPHAGIVREAAPVTALADGLLPAAWTGGAA